jgi:hypothetical protein
MKNHQPAFFSRHFILPKEENIHIHHQFSLTSRTKRLKNAGQRAREMLKIELQQKEMPKCYFRPEWIKNEEKTNKT